jgi:predicted dehydrogenase
MAEVFSLVDSDDLPKSGPEESVVILGQIEKGKKKRRIIYDQPEVPSTDAMQSELLEFLRCVAKGTRPLVSGEDGLHALEVAIKITNIIHKN